MPTKTASTPTPAPEVPVTDTPKCPRCHGTAKMIDKAPPGESGDVIRCDLEDTCVAQSTALNAPPMPSGSHVEPAPATLTTFFEQFEAWCEGDRASEMPFLRDTTVVPSRRGWESEITLGHVAACLSLLMKRRRTNGYCDLTDLVRATGLFFDTSTEHGAARELKAERDLHDALAECPRVAWVPGEYRIRA